MNQMPTVYQNFLFYFFIYFQIFSACYAHVQVRIRQHMRLICAQTGLKCLKVDLAGATFIHYLQNKPMSKDIHAELLKPVDAHAFQRPEETQASPAEV